MLDSTSPRNVLRAAIASRDAAAEQEVKAAKAVVRAKQLLDDAEQTLALLAGLEDEITNFRAGEIRMWAENGSERPTGALPPHLASKRDYKAEVETKLSAARSTHELLSKELIAAVGRKQDLDESVQRAAAAVLIAEGNTIVTELHLARRAVWALEDRLKSICSVRYKAADGRSVLIGAPAGFFAALNETAPPMLAGNVPKPHVVELQRWQNYLDALAEGDPDSTFDSI
jgi:hypothetical protein